MRQSQTGTGGGVQLLSKQMRVIVCIIQTYGELILSEKSEFNFDEVIDRTNTDSVKWGFLNERYGDSDIIPLPVADMDFRVAEPILEAINERTHHGIFGYAMPRPSYYTAIIKWFEKRHNWKIEKEWILSSPGVVPAVFVAVQTFTQPGDKILVQTPAYYPFLMAPMLGRQVVTSELLFDGKSYKMDYEDMAKKAKDPLVKMAILCSPHNPVGRVWSKDELKQFGDICLENHLLIFSDEIHWDLTLHNNKHIPFLTVSDDFRPRTIVGTSASKSFNLAGLQNSTIIVEQEHLRSDLKQGLSKAGIWVPNVFGMVATQAAYDHGEQWLNAVNQYVWENYLFLKDYFAEHLPQANVVEPEGTYLVWVDFRSFGLDPKKLEEVMLKQAKVALDEGYIFGPGGEGFERFNIACPRIILQEALERIKEAFKSTS